MSFTQPLALLLLLTLAYFLWLAWPRGRLTWRDRVSLALRALLVALLVFGLAGAQTVHGGDELAVVFLVDVSDSVGPAGKATELDFVRRALDQMTAKDQAAIVLFGQNALVERQMSPVKQLSEITSVPNPRGTDLAAAIRLALALFPPGAAWQYGLGRSVAWTSDATGRWAQPWVTWGDFTRFWAQAVRWTIRDEQNQSAELTVQAAGFRATLTLDAQDSAGQFLNGLSVTTTVIGPSRQTQEMPLRQTAPGRYSADFMPAQEGAYLVQATSEQFSITSGWVNPYSPEYRSLGGNPGLLQQIASVGQGRLLNQPAEAFAHTIPATPTTRDIWPMLLTLVALLLPFDVAARRLMLGPRDLARLLDAIRKRWPGRKPLGETAPRVARLMSAKERAATARPAAPPVEAAPPRAEEPAPSPPSPAPAPGALADRLLEAKKRARRGVNDENKE